jgi:DNA-directed RNA polymerase I, II, and III subunit RPABC1
MQRVIQTMSEMIIQRGYKITDIEDDKIIGINSKEEHIILFTISTNKFNSDRTKEYISLVHKMGMNHCIVVFIDCVTPMAKKLIDNSVDIIVELFHIDELQYNITQHRLVPQHIKLSDVDAKEFKKNQGLKHPIILRTDPIARFYLYQRGDIIRIIRPGGYVTHRIVK